MIILNENEELDSILEDMYLEGYYQAIEEMENPVDSYKKRKAAEEEEKERKAVELYHGKAPRKPGNYAAKYSAIGGVLGGGLIAAPALSIDTMNNKEKAAFIGSGAVTGAAIGGALGKGRELWQHRKQKKYEDETRKTRILFRSMR